MNVVGFRVVLAAVELTYVIGFFVGFGFGRAGVVLSQGDGRGFVMKFGSVVTCHGVDDHAPEEKTKKFLRKLSTENEISKPH